MNRGIVVAGVVGSIVAVGTGALAGGAYGRVPTLSTAGAMTIAVPGVPGPYCMYGVEKRLYELPGVARVEMLWDTEAIRVVPTPGATITADMLRSAMERAQYPSRYTIE